MNDLRHDVDGSAAPYGGRLSENPGRPVNNDECCRETEPAIGCEVRDEPCCNADIQPMKPKMRNFMVEQLNHGYIIRIDCHSFAIESQEKLSKLLDLYSKDPNKMETLWFKNNLEGYL